VGGAGNGMTGVNHLYTGYVTPNGAAQPRNLLIGGAGGSVMYSMQDDIEIAGTTRYDANDAALLALLTEWGRRDVDGTYSARVAHLTSGGGLNGNYVLNASTISHGSSRHLLLGLDGQHLYFARTAGSPVRDVTVRVNPSEIVFDI
jgi:hypothetical protein